MLKIIIIVLIIAAFIWFIYTREHSTLSYDTSKVTLALNKKKLILNLPQMQREHAEFPMVSVEQNILKSSDGDFLVFEQGETDKLYQFNFSTPQSVQMLFDAKSIDTIVQANNLYFMQVRLKNETVLNVIARQSDDQSLSLFYGLNTTMFMRVINALKPADCLDHHKVIDNILSTKKQDEALKTHWSTPLNALESLIVPSDTR